MNITDYEKEGVISQCLLVKKYLKATWPFAWRNTRIETEEPEPLDIALFLVAYRMNSDLTMIAIPRAKSAGRSREFNTHDYACDN